MGFFDRFKSKEKVSEELPPIDMSLIGTDMHSHLIFGIDDGAVSLENSLELIEKLYDMGYRKFYTTPHIFRDLYFNSKSTILPAYEKVKEALATKTWEIEFVPAAEYYCDEHFEELIEKNDLLLMGKNYVLFEYSFETEPANAKRVIFNLQLQGLKPILAHPERYDYFHQQFHKYEELVERDVFLQLNINSLTGHYGPGVKKTSERLIDAGLISFIGTDCHHLGHISLTEQARRMPYLKKLIESGKLKNREL